MSEGEGGLVEPPKAVLPQNTVVINGSAYNLLAQLTEGIRNDMRAMEARLTTQAQLHVDEHNDMHDKLEIDARDRHRRVGERLTALEKAGLTDDLHNAYSEGRLSFITTVRVFLARNRTWLLYIALLLIGVVAGTTATNDIFSHITVHP